MLKKKTILLEATIDYQIDELAFRCKLANGHEFTAFLPRANKAMSDQLSNGTLINASFTPYDMSKAEIVI